MKKNIKPEGDIQMELRAYIKERLNAKRIQQKEFAEKLDRDPATINNWIKGRQPIPLDMIEVIANALEEKSPLPMYKMAGIFVNHPAASLIDELADATDDEIDLVKRLTRTLLNKKND